MATFQVGIGKEDIQEGVLLPEDWYVMRIIEEPFEDKNAAWKAVGKDLPYKVASEVNEKAGKNIVLRLVMESEIPEFHERRFTKWLSLPNAGDEGKYMNDGQPKVDWKASIIYKWVEAFQGIVEGKEVTLAQGQKALVYVIQEIDRRESSDGAIVNTISMNVHPRALGAGGESPFGQPTLEGEEDDLPF